MKKQTIPTPLLTVGLDIGYGVTKALSPDKEPIVFPSVCGHARQIKFRAEELIGWYPGDQITDESGDWFVGDLALSQVPIGELLRLRGRAARKDAFGYEFRVRMARVALGKLLMSVPGVGDVIQVRIATGLPVDHMAQASQLKEALIGRHPIRTDSVNVVADITEVMVMPQPYGSIYAAMLTPDGDINRYHTALRTGVCDVGTYTIDLALDDEGEFVDARSGSVEGGVYTAQERLETMLEAEYGEKPSYGALEELLRTGKYKAYGQMVDYRAEVQQALEPLRSATMSLAGDKWKTGASVDAIYLSGGGAALVYDQVHEAFPQAQLMDNPQLANARGYLSYARHTLSHNL
jgi:plasmid segregation protein ParM